MLDRGQFNPIYKDMEVEEEGDNSYDDFFRPKSPFKTTFQDSFDEDSNSDLIYFENGSTSSINLNHYLHDQTDLYNDFRSKSDADLTKFKNHQKELIKMLNQQREKFSSSKINDVEMIESEKLNREEDLNSLNTCNNEINNKNQSLSSVIPNHNSSICNPMIPNIIIKSTINNSNSFVNNTTSLPQSKSSLSTLDSKSINFAVSAVLSTVNNSSTSINSSSSNTSLTPTTPIPNSSAPVLNNSNNTNGPAQINSNLNNNLTDYDRLFPSTASNSDRQISSPSQNSSSANLITSISNSNLHLNTQTTLVNNLQKSQQQSPQIIPQTIQQQWSKQQQQTQMNELTITNSSNMLKLKYQNSNANNLNSEPKLTPTDVT